ncbi:Conserved_hypothetical protein [Hexamita inflata]|uniref:MORN repeat protein n=1 Tax=Hexamita inflata TaxID=28002 RepID=A0AA86R937_9EUKA|nr:Conserved hypothetical protein [Hexamita inflata]
MQENTTTGIQFQPINIYFQTQLQQILNIKPMKLFLKVIINHLLHCLQGRCYINLLIKEFHHVQLPYKQVTNAIRSLSIEVNPIYYCLTQLQPTKRYFQTFYFILTQHTLISTPTQCKIPYPPTNTQTPFILVNRLTASSTGLVPFASTTAPFSLESSQMIKLSAENSFTRRISFTRGSFKVSRDTGVENSHALNSHILAISLTTRCTELDGQFVLEWGEVNNGTLTKEKSVYTGSFTGQGFQYKSGTLKENDQIYTGDFDNNEFSGGGTLVYADSSVYAGQFKNNLKHGSGKLTFSNKNTFKGTFNNDQFEFGTYTFENGNIYEGEFKNNEFNGKGVLKWKGGYYSGEFADDQFDGEGTITLENGFVVKGRFKNGELVQ